ncbi:MAG: hypothetical protein ASARMPREDX12_007336 [Alectoria sarmentosa]|nr:MAG: hypothetical protein ASARMPRED_004724 [Alectoria sarmentosa]CAD6593591.1 MAG: hypothetical protein ASARMPREDX12_007336 [Alectoria sarmentosa]
MFDLLSLPNEILYRIIECVDLGDREHFAASCHLLESLATKALKEHRARKHHSYTNPVCSGSHENDGGDDHPLCLLAEICENRQVAWYPTSLTIKGCGYEEEEHKDEDFVEDEDWEELLYYGEVYDPWRSDAVYVCRNMERCAEEVQKLVYGSGYFDEKGNERWYNHIRRGNRGAALGLLLTLLPNLEILTFHEYTWKARQFKKIVQRITEPCDRNSSETRKVGGKVLTKLREVELHGSVPAASDRDEDVFEDFDLAGHFAKLPSVKRIHADSANNCSRLSNNPWVQVGPRTSNIDDISTGYGRMNATYMTECLGFLKALWKFHYDYSSPYESDNELNRNGVSLILESLLKHANISLDTLTLKTNYPSSLQGSIVILISLHSFEKLKKASLNCHLYAPVFKENKEGSLISAPNEIKSLNIASGSSSFEASKTFEVSKLVDILPNSIEVIEFWGQMAMKHVEALFQGLAEHKADRLSHLKEIVFYETANMMSVVMKEMSETL